MTPFQGGSTPGSHAQREPAASGPLSHAHARRRSLYACGHCVATSTEKAVAASACWAQRWGGEGEGEGHVFGTPMKTQTHKVGGRQRVGGAGCVPDTFSLATAIPSFYLSAGPRPAGTGRRAATGRRHSRTLASSRTSRAEAERSLPPAGRRLTGTRRGGLHSGAVMP